MYFDPYSLPVCNVSNGAPVNISISIGVFLLLREGIPCKNGSSSIVTSNTGMRHRIEYEECANR